MQRKLPGRLAARRPGRPAPCRPNRPANASIPEVADAVQEFLTDWLIRRNYQEAAAFLAPDVLPCVADSMEMNPKTSPERLRQASLQLLEKTADEWGRPTSLTQAMNPVIPWSPACACLKHAFEQDFTIVEAPTELGAQYECGVDAAEEVRAVSAPQYGTYYGAVLQVVTEGQPGGAIVFVWRRVAGEWRLVAYRAVD